MSMKERLLLIIFISICGPIFCFHFFQILHEISKKLKLLCANLSQTKHDLPNNWPEVSKYLCTTVGAT